MKQEIRPMDLLYFAGEDEYYIYLGPVSLSTVRIEKLVRLNFTDGQVEGDRLLIPVDINELDGVSRLYNVIDALSIFEEISMAKRGVASVLNGPL